MELEVTWLLLKLLMISNKNIIKVAGNNKYIDSLLQNHYFQMM